MQVLLRDGLFCVLGIANDFTIKMHLKSFYFNNELRMILLAKYIENNQRRTYFRQKWCELKSLQEIISYFRSGHFTHCQKMKTRVIKKLLKKVRL